MKFCNARYLTLLLGALSTTAVALDHTNRYAGVRFQPFPVHNTSPWATHIDIAFDSARAHHAYNTHGDPTDLFNEYGPSQIDALTIIPTGPAPAYANQSERERVAYAIRDQLQLTRDEAAVIYTGKYAQEQITIEWMQHLMSGLFIHLNLPFKRQKLTGISFHTKLDVSKYSAQTAAPNLTGAQKYDGFLQLLTSQYANPAALAETSSLPRALTEAGLAQLQTDFIKSDIGDPGIYVGWGGEKLFKKSIIEYINGTLRLGAVLPVARRYNNDQVFSLPFGYDKHWGVAGRGCGELGLLKFLAAGGSIGTTIFFSRSYPKRLKTDPLQNGWIMLDQGVAHVDQGSLWDLSAYVKAQLTSYGAAAWFGAVYFNQSPTHFTQRDNPELFTKEALNSDARLKSWRHYVLHFGASWDMKQFLLRKTGPFFAFTYDYSLSGKYVWRTDVIGGRAGFHCSWKW